MRLSVIVPVLNDQELLERSLAAIRNGAPDAEIVIVDGGSADQSVDIARRFGDQVVVAPRGRSRQQNEGALFSSGDVLAFVHADTIVPATFLEDIQLALNDPEVCGGRFDVVLDDDGTPAKLIGKLISLRSRLTRSGTAIRPSSSGAKSSSRWAALHKFRSAKMSTSCADSSVLGEWLVCDLASSPRHGAGAAADSSKQCCGCGSSSCLSCLELRPSAWRGGMRIFGNRNSEAGNRQASRPWLSVWRRYLVVIAAGNFLWEMAQLSAFVDWRQGSWKWLIFIVTIGTAGDLLIAATSLGLSLLVFGNRFRPEGSASYWRVALAAGLLGLGYTAYSEWRHAVVLRYWRYSKLMPVVPHLGIGVLPLLQWIVIPAAAFCHARPRRSNR